MAKTATSKLTKNSEVSLEELADITSFSKSYLTKLAAQGYFKSERHGCYRLGNVWLGLLKNAKEDKRAPETPAMTRVHEARAKQIEQRTAREAGELVTYRHHSDMVALIVGNFSAFLSGLPAQLTRDLTLREQFRKVISSERSRLTAYWEQIARMGDDETPPGFSDTDDDQEGGTDV